MGKLYGKSGGEGEEEEKRETNPLQILMNNRKKVYKRKVPNESFDF